MIEKKILIVEDNAIIARETSERLKRLGYTVTGIAARGIDAIENVRASLPDLILMDINLKGEMDGIEAAGKIGEFSDAPVIYLTAYSDDLTLQRAMQTKPVAYLIKPFKERELYSNIEMAIYKHKAEKKTGISDETDEIIRAFADLPECVIVTDNEDRILFMNRSASHLIGFSAEETLGSLISTVFTIRRGSPRLEETLKKKSTGFPLLQEERIRVDLITRGGSSVPVITEATAITDSLGIREGFALVFWVDEPGS
ncbi:ATP-binding response regulator [Methanosphaerula palustris]|uniref:Putative PAS/PAC sensor protein n=1 Tax=Methanosphaerula palustris (strain ATCC BAA-1556 / DSM 19958 / E1-9c) TaxID=521011 RepID=B8GI92_METPE|nr:response regulator [Methanosphaerula palustris]ACL15443.1 putative PAS/PAC sensor protein [Methanosphaerula palustris E1-9c]